MISPRPIPNRNIRIWITPTSALVLWICLWLNLNTGFWNINLPDTFYDLQLSVRAALPIAVFPLATFLLLLRKRLPLPRSSPSRLLLVYGMLSTLAALFSPQPLWSLYWSVCFLSTILAAWMFVEPWYSLESARQLLLITWIATFVVAAVISYEARDSVFGDINTGYYNVFTELNGLSRASGVARWAAVPGLVSLVHVYYNRRFSHIAFFLATATISFFIVYRMQSRGAIFGSVAALLFTLIISSKIRRYALPFAVLAIIVLFILDSPTSVSNSLAAYLERGQTREQFLSMTGRTRAYEESFSAIEEAPIFGRGQWADRLTIKEHVHNSFLQSLLNAGILGGIPYTASWITGWWLFYKLQKRRAELVLKDQVHLLECGAVMMFFTVRAIPETTTASFAVDLLVMVAIYVYLESLTLSIKSKHHPVYISRSRIGPLQYSQNVHAIYRA